MKPGKKIFNYFSVMLVALVLVGILFVPAGSFGITLPKSYDNKIITQNWISPLGKVISVQPGYSPILSNQYSNDIKIDWWGRSADTPTCGNCGAGNPFIKPHQNLW
jgi:hypothetical protein